jgi:hypothetical protein
MTTPPQNWPARVPPNRSRLDSATVHGLSEIWTGRLPMTTLSGDARAGVVSDITAVAAARASVGT